MANETQAVPNNFDALSFLDEAGGLAWAILIVLVAMSLACWFITLTRIWDQRKINKDFLEARKKFWTSGNLHDGIAALGARENVFRMLAEDGLRAKQYHQGHLTEQMPPTEANSANLSAVNATTVLMNQSGSEGITADRVTMERSGSRSIDAKSVQMDQSGVVALSTEQAVLLKSSTVQAVAEEARLSHSSALFLSSGKASIENSRIAIFAGSTDGDVHPLITGRTAGILIGALAALLVLMFALRRTGSRD